MPVATVLEAEASPHWPSPRGPLGSMLEAGSESESLQSPCWPTPPVPVEAILEEASSSKSPLFHSFLATLPDHLLDKLPEIWHKVWKPTQGQSSAKFIHPGYEVISPDSLTVEKDRITDLFGSRCTCSSSRCCSRTSASQSRHEGQDGRRTVQSSFMPRLSSTVTSEPLKNTFLAFELSRTIHQLLRLWSKLSEAISQPLMKLLSLVKRNLSTPGQSSPPRPAMTSWPLSTMRRRAPKNPPSSTISAARRLPPRSTQEQSTGVQVGTTWIFPAVRPSYFVRPSCSSALIYSLEDLSVIYQTQSAAASTMSSRLRFRLRRRDSELSRVRVNITTSTRRLRSLWKLPGLGYEL